MTPKEKGVWIPLDEKPSEYIVTGIPRENETVVLTYTNNPLHSTAKRVGSASENKDVFKAKKVGMTFFYSANV